MADQAEIYKFPDASEREIREKRGALLNDGFTRIPNSILEALISAPITDRERRVALSVARLTYGWNKESARASAGLLAKITGIHKDNIGGALTGLLERGIVRRHGGSRSPVSLNTNLEEWDIHRQERPVPTPKSKRPKSGQFDPTESGQFDPPSKDRKDINPLTTFEGDAYDPDPAPNPKPKPATKPKGYPESFEVCWQEYPKREGSNPKNRAFTGWKARLKEGVTEDEMLAGTKRYAAFIRAKGDENTAYVMQAQRFYGSSREFENTWGKPAPRPSRNEHVNPYADMDDCAGRIVIPDLPPDADTWGRK